jgi:Rrf2 family protein
MHLTRESEYALLALTYLAEAAGDAEVSVGEIAEARDMPVHFLAKILQKLGRNGIVSGGRGRGRGYTLARHTNDITLDEVLGAVEPPENMESCLLWQGYCGDANPCPLHHRLRPVHRHIRELLGKVTLADYLKDSQHRGIRGADLPV